MFDLYILLLIVFRVMQSTCHSNVIIAHDCSSTKGHGIDTQNYIREIGATAVRIVNQLFQEGDFLLYTYSSFQLFSSSFNGIFFYYRHGFAINMHISLNFDMFFWSFFFISKEYLENTFYI